MITTQNEMLMPTLFERYKKKLVAVLNASLIWNIAKLPYNNFDLQIKKYEEECDEAIEAEKNSYQNMIEELADVLIAIGGLMRFDEEIAQNALHEFMECLDKYVFMDVVDYAEQKIQILYERTYSDGYHHDEEYHD